MNMDGQSEAERRIESPGKHSNQFRAEASYQHDVEFRRFNRACSQILQLNGKFEDLTKRYTAAKAEDDKNFRYTLRNRMLVVEGVLTAYCKYATLKKLQILKLRRQLQLADEEDSYNDNGEH